MLNEEIIKELAKYDEYFDGFSYNDIIQEKDEEVPEEMQEIIEGEPVEPETDENEKDEIDSSEEEMKMIPHEEFIEEKMEVQNTNNGQVKEDVESNAENQINNGEISDITHDIKDKIEIEESDSVKNEEVEPKNEGDNQIQDELKKPLSKTKELQEPLVDINNGEVIHKAESTAPSDH